MKSGRKVEHHAGFWVYPGTVNYWTGRPGEVVCEWVRVVVRRARCRAKELEETRPLVRAMTK